MAMPGKRHGRLRIAVAVTGIVGLASSLAVTACRNSETVQLENELQLVRSCDSLTQAFMVTLKGELTAALADGGPAHAVGVCKVTAPEIAARFSRTSGWSIKRLSDKSRNSANAPDAYEANVLARLAAADGPPVFYEWQRSGPSDSTFVYFKAIRTAEVCLACHGPRETLSADLLAMLAEEYPDDRATGYAAGDLRGAFVVRVEASTRP